MTGRDLYLIGAGDHGRVLLDALFLNQSKVRGLSDPSFTIGDRIMGVVVIDENDLLLLDRSAVALVNGLGGRHSAARRNAIFHRYTRLGFSFVGVIHPSVLIGSGCMIHESAQLLAGVVIQPHVQIGVNTVVNTSSVVEHDCQIGTNCFVGPRCVLSGRVEIGDETFVGAGATILPGIHIGSMAVVGAGAVVTRDVAPGVTVVGNPARTVKNSS